MSVRFVIGRAGAGKTDYCLEAVRRRLVESPVDGHRLLLIVPEQAALQTERALIADPRLGGSHRGEVMGFRRLAQRIAGTVGPGDVAPASNRCPKALSPNGRAMTLRYVLGQIAAKLQYYRCGAGRKPVLHGGLVDQLARSIGEFFDEAVSPDDLAEAAAACTDDPLRARKLTDLHLIYSAYLQHLGTNRLDPSQYLAVARRQVADTPWLRGVEVWVDGFAGFTRQESLMLARLATVASRVEVTLMADPEAVARNPCRGRDLPVDSTDLFAKTLRTYLCLGDDFIEAGVDVEEPLLLEPARSPRFGSIRQLSALERNLASGSLSATESPGEEPPAVELVELPDRRVEVDYAVSRLCQWVQREEDPLRYRDIALIVRDLEPYHDLLSAALADGNVPFFIDRRRPTAHHPLVELLRSLVSLAAESMSVESVRLLLKTGLLGISDEAADELENFILARGISGFDLWTGDDWSPVPQDARLRLPDQPPPEPTAVEQQEAARVNAARRALVERVGQWLAFARRADGVNGRDWATQLAGALQRLNVAEQLESWARQAEEDGDLDAAEEHRQIWRDAVAFIDDLADALGEQVMEVGELSAVLEAGLSQFTLGLAPPMLDQVLVGAIERSRHPEIKAAVILGFNDTAFPRAGGEDSILNDDDRTYLAEAGLRVGPSRRQRILEERLLLYVAVTRASEAMVLTYPAADEQGRPLRVSPFAEDLRAACPNLGEPRVDDLVGVRRKWPLMSSGGLAAALALEFGGRPRSPADDGSSRAAWNDLYEAARRDDQLAGRIGRALSSLDYANDAHLSPETVERSVSAPLQVSVSQLERYAACPFQHFSDYGLKLRERRLAELKEVDVGKLHHAILEDFVGRLVEQGEPLGRLDEAAVLRRLADSTARVGLRPPLEGALSLARETYLMRRSREDLARVVRSQRDVEAAGRFRAGGTEVAFGMEGTSSLPALAIDTPGGRQVKLRGYIDRVDLAELADEMLGVVIDYKRTTGKRLKLSEVYHGLSLQLLGYLLVLAEHGATLAGRPIRPVGAFYVSLLADYALLDHPEDYDQERHSALKGHRPRGVLDVGRMDALETGYDTGKSQVYQVQTKEGAIQYTDTSDAADPDQFTALLERTRYKLGSLADGILDGDISVAPYRLGTFSPCSWCAFGSFCRFEFGRGPMRFLETLKRSEVLARLSSVGREATS